MPFLFLCVIFMLSDRTRGVLSNLLLLSESHWRHQKAAPGGQLRSPPLSSTSRILSCPQTPNRQDELRLTHSSQGSFPACRGVDDFPAHMGSRTGAVARSQLLINSVNTLINTGVSILENQIFNGSILFRYLTVQSG